MLLAYATGAFGLSYMSMLGFLAPLRARELGASVEEVGFIVGLGAFSSMLTAVPAGALSDRFGSRRTFIGGAFLALLAAVGLAFSTNLWALAAFQFVRGFPQVMGWVGAMTYVTGLGSADQRASITGRFSLATNVAGIASPALIGTVAQVWGVVFGFQFVAAYCLLFALLGFLLVETHAPAFAHGRAPITGYGAAGSMMKLPPVQVVMLLSVARIATNAGWVAFFPLFLVEHGTPASLAGTVISVVGLASAANSTMAASYARRGGIPKVIAIFTLAGSFGVSLSPVLVALPWAYIPALAVGASQGVTLPLLLTMLSQHTAGQLRGVAMGMREGINQATAMVTPILTGVALERFGPVGFMAGSVLVVGALSAASVINRRVGRPS